MPRAKGGPKTRRRHKRQLKLASGFVGGRKLYRQARSTLEKGLTYAYRDRKQKKREFRALWIARINALARENGISYSSLMNGLKKAGVEVDRKMLARLAQERDALFTELVRTAKSALGRSGELTEIMRGMREVPNAERPAIGQLINQIKNEVEARVEALSEKLKAASLTKSLNEKRLDVTLPGMRIARGHIHPITDILEQMLAIFESMGFEVAM